MVKYHWQLDMYDHILGKLVNMGNNPETFLMKRTLRNPES